SERAVTESWFSLQDVVPRVREILLFAKAARELRHESVLFLRCVTLNVVRRIVCSVGARITREADRLLLVLPFASASKEPESIPQYPSAEHKDVIVIMIHRSADRNAQCAQAIVDIVVLHGTCLQLGHRLAM